MQLNTKLATILHIGWHRAQKHFGAPAAELLPLCKPFKVLELSRLGDDASLATHCDRHPRRSRCLFRGVWVSGGGCLDPLSSDLTTPTSPDIRSWESASRFPKSGAEASTSLYNLKFSEKLPGVKHGKHHSLASS